MEVLLEGDLLLPAGQADVHSVAGCICAGTRHLQRGEVDSALKAYLAGRTQLEAEQRLESAEGARIVLGLAGAKAMQQDLHRAAEGYQEAVHILERTLTLESFEGLLALTLLGDVRHQQQRFVEAEKV